MRYFAWKQLNSKYMKGQTLHTPEQIATLVEALGKQRDRHEFHLSMQTFDDSGKALHCPLYFDFDGENALDDCRLAVDTIEWKFGDYPRIYFSGNAGFHLIMDYKVEHPYCNLITEEFAKQVADFDGLDTQIYAARHLLRKPHSVHFKSGLYKIELSIDDLYSKDMKAFREMATQPLPDLDLSYSYDLDALNGAIKKATEEVEKVLSAPRAEGCTDARRWQDQIRPCIAKIIVTEPYDGQWNYTASIIARFFCSLGADQDEALGAMFEHTHWLEDEGHVRKVFKSIYRGAAKFGCRNTPLLQQHCDKFCDYSSEDIVLWK